MLTANPEALHYTTTLREATLHDVAAFTLRYAATLRLPRYFLCHFSFSSTRLAALVRTTPTGCVTHLLLVRALAALGEPTGLLDATTCPHFLYSFVTSLCVSDAF
jgi:hypothetical protein